MTTQRQMDEYYRRKAVYESELAAYQAKLVRYRADLDHWNSMSPEERAACHDAAEQQSRFGWGILLVAFTAIGLYIFLNKYFHGAWFWVIWVGVILTFLAAVIWQIHHVGRAARGLGYAVVAIFIGFVAELVFDRLFPHTIGKHTAYAVDIIAPLLGFLVGFNARASGAPQAPSPPRAPTIPGPGF